MRICILSTVPIALLCCLSLAAGPTTQPSSPDKGFMNKAAQINLTEITLGKLAQQQASTAVVKQFGQRMITDHTKANDQLLTIAMNKKMTLPNGMNGKSQAMYSHLASLKGGAFDKAYIADMVKGHKAAIKLFQKEATSGMDRQLKNWARKTVPMLKEHLKLAKQAMAELGKGQ